VLAKARLLVSGSAALPAAEHARLERGLRSAAAPIRDAAGRVIAAANVGAHAGRVTVA
jgi:IclR family pca regulon transcriptional regulator